MEKVEGEKAPIMEGGEDVLNMDDDFDDKDGGGFAQNDREDADSANNDDDEDIPVPKKGSGAKPKEQVKGDKLENQPYDLAVDVNDSEEIESDEEDDEVNMNDVQTEN